MIKVCRLHGTQCGPSTAAPERVLEKMHAYVENRIDEWHAGTYDGPLHEFLGWSWEEYKLYVTDNVLPDRMFEAIR